MHHHHPRSMQRSALSATFDFWYAPSQPSSDEITEGGRSASSQPQQQQIQPLLPAPHAQLLFEDEQPIFVELKGQDHRQHPTEEGEHDDESDDDDQDDDDFLLMMDITTNAPQAQTAVTQSQGPPLPHIFGGGGTRRPSWLMGFARPRSESTTSTVKSPEQLVVKSSSSPTTHNEAHLGNNSKNKLKRMISIHHHHHEDASAKNTMAAEARNQNLLLHSLPPGLVRVPSGSSLDDEEDCSSSSSSDSSSLCASPTSSSQRSSNSTTSRPKGVSFSPAVKVQPIPHSSLLSHSQRLRMYTSSDEVRKNKIRNKIEYRHDGYDWRNVSEEWEMGVDMVTGELIHPVHEAQSSHHHNNCAHAQLTPRS